MTGTELELILDNKMHLLTEKGMGGRVSYIAKRFSKASNKYMKSYYDSKKKYTHKVFRCKQLYMDRQ